MKIIGLDIGEKRIGVALADTSVKIASPHSTIIVDGTEADQIKHLMATERTSLLVIGLPRNSKGEETAQTQIVRLFSLKLESRGAKIKFQDESLTSVLAERRLKLRKKAYKKEDIDAEAATIILQDFIESYAPTPDSTENNSDTRRVGGGLAPRPLEAHKTRRVQPEKIPSSDLSRSAGSARIFPERNVSKKGLGEVPRKKASFRSFILPAILILFFTAASGLSIWFTSGTLALSSSPLRQPFTITPGQSTRAIADSLVTAGLIRNPTVFALAAYLTGATIPAKTHFISPSEDIWQILDQLK